MEQKYDIVTFLEGKKKIGNICMIIIIGSFRYLHDKKTSEIKMNI